MTQARLHAVPQPDDCTGLVTRLLLRCAGGDQAALGTLVDLSHRAVLGTLVGHDPDASDDEVVEVFREVWRRAPRFRAGQDAVAWLLAVAADVASPAPVEPVPAAS